MRNVLIFFKTHKILHSVCTGMRKSLQSISVIAIIFNSCNCYLFRLQCTYTHTWTKELFAVVKLTSPSDQIISCEMWTHDSYIEQQFPLPTKIHYKFVMMKNVRHARCIYEIETIKIQKVMMMIIKFHWRRAGSSWKIELDIHRTQQFVNLLITVNF